LRKSDYHLGYLNLLKQLTVTDDLGYNNFCEQFDIIAKNECHKIFVIIDNRHVTGTITCIVEPKFIHGFKNVGHIEDIVVDKDHRGKGYGKLLLFKAIKFANKSNCYKIILNCSKDNIGFYESCGFTSGNYEMRFDCHKNVTSHKCP